MLIGIFLCQGSVYSADDSYLRVPVGISNDRKQQALKKLRAVSVKPKNASILTDMLEVPRYASEELTRRAKSILEYAKEIEEFLGVHRINSVRYEIAREEDSDGGYVIRFIFGTELGQISFYAQLRHSRAMSIEQLKRNTIDSWKDDKVEFTEVDPDGDWIKYKIAGSSFEFTAKRNNPTTLEYKMTLEAAQEGVFPSCTIIADSLIIRGIDNGISLEELPNSSEWTDFFLENEEHFVKEIGRAYGKLNKRARITQYDIKLTHIFITKDRRVYLIDLSTQGEEGAFSSRSGTIYREDVDIEFVTVALRVWLDPFLGLGKVLDYRKEEYSRWMREGYNEIKIIDRINLDKLQRVRGQI